jgi:hypothetical protein
VSDTTLETPDALGPEGRQAAHPAGPHTARPPFWRRHVWWFVALAVVVIAELVLRWANTRPGYDPYGWLIWGYQTLHGSLNLGGAPSWKPFTYVFTVPYSLFGHYALHLWELTAVSVSLAGAVFGGRIAYRLTEVDGGRRWAQIVAAVVGGASVLGIQQYFHYVLSSQSDSMLVTVCLAAIDMWLCGRLAWAWWLGVLAGLGRPELWAFTAPYGLWILWKRPSMRWMVVAGGVITAFLWFGIPTITNGKPDVAGQLALKSPRELHSNKVVGTIDRFISNQYLVTWIAALIAVGLAVLRRNWKVLALAGMAAWWVIVEIGFVLHGFPGVPRYVFEPAALGGVLAGIAVGWLLQDARAYQRSLPAWAGIPLAALIVLALVPDAKGAWDTEHKDVYHERARTQRILQLGSYITALGGPNRIEACGGALLNVEYVSIMGWYLHRNTGQVAYQPLKVLKRSNPVIYFILLPNGWAVQPLRPQHAHVAGCASLKSMYVPTAHHPQGVLIPK